MIGVIRPAKRKIDFENILTLVLIPGQHGAQFTSSEESLARTLKTHGKNVLAPILPPSRFELCNTLLLPLKMVDVTVLLKPLTGLQMYHQHFVGLSPT